MESYERDENAETANIAGMWNLQIEVMGQQFPITMDLKQDGESVGGTLDSAFIAGEFTGKVSGDKLTGTAQTEYKGQAVALDVAGTVDGDSISGTFSTPMIPAPIAFSGKRE